MDAKYGGFCQCGARYEAGASITYSREARKAIKCPACTVPSVGEAAGAGAKTATAVFRVRVQRVKRQKDSGWRVVSVTADQLPAGEWPVMAGAAFDMRGTFMSETNPGDVLDVKGAFKPHESYGWQLNVDVAVPVLEGTDQALETWLGNLPHIGPARAADIIHEFGGRLGVLAMLDSPLGEDDVMDETGAEFRAGVPLPAWTRLAEVSGITPVRAREIKEAYDGMADFRDSALFLAELQVGEELASSILKAYKGGTQRRLRENPYEALMELGTGFKKADEIARRPPLSIRPDDPRRCAAGVLSLFEEQANEGHTWSARTDIGLPKDPPREGSFGSPDTLPVHIGPDGLLERGDADWSVAAPAAGGGAYLAGELGAEMNDDEIPF